MELRYAFENELIQAVALGQQHKEKMLLSIFNEQMFEKRLQDPLRNAKNYCVIMNTLPRSPRIRRLRQVFLILLSGSQLILRERVSAAMR
jgi:hypothetical protein